MRKNPGDLIDKLNQIKDGAELILEEYVQEYSEYNIDNIANELIAIIAGMESVRLRLHSEEVNPF